MAPRHRPRLRAGRAAIRFRCIFTCLIFTCLIFTCPIFISLIFISPGPTTTRNIRCSKP